MRITTSGTRYPPARAQWHMLRRILETYRQMLGAAARIELGHGGCTGWDTAAHYAGLRVGMLPVRMPACDVEDKWKAKLADIYLDVYPERALVRNRVLAKTADVALAGPRFAENDRRSQRSGTWHYVRCAREYHRQLIIVSAFGQVELSPGVWPASVQALCREAA